MEHDIYFRDLNLSALKDSLILLDLEGTIAPQGAVEIDPASRAAIQKLAAQGNQIYICSNSVIAQSIATTSGLEFVQRNKQKPHVDASLREFLGRTEKPVVVIGDSYYYDGLFAKRLGVPCIIVKSLGKKKVSLLDTIFFGYIRRFIRKPWALIEPTSETITILTKTPRSSGKEEVSRHATEIAELLVDGLSQSGIRVERDPAESEMSSTVCVIGSADALKYALLQKQKGFVGTIIAGPEIGYPASSDRILLENGAVNRFVVATQWVKEALSKEDQYFNRAEVVPIGAADVGVSSADKTKGDIVVYARNVPEALFHDVMTSLWQHQVSIVVSKDGSFDSKKYEQLLRTARAVVYMAGQDTSSLALKKAWMANAPTLCWKPQAGAQEIPKGCGLTFQDATDFNSALSDFLTHLPTYQPRVYALSECTQATMAARYMAVMRSAWQDRVSG